MSASKVFLYILPFFFFSCHSQENEEIEDKINGLSFVASNRKLTYKDVEPAVNVNANWVALMPFGFMMTDDNPELTFNSKWQWWGETSEGIITTAALFNKKGIKRMLKPQLWIKGGKFTGNISMKTTEDWLLLEENYETFILHFAKLAAQEHIELFCIGTELNSFVSARPNFWIQLIDKIKNVYHGKLTYAENWDSYKKPSFWSELDYIGIDAYFPLSPNKTPSIHELNNSWLPIKNEIQELSYKYQRPILFTEFGYRSIDYTAKQPWDSSIDPPYNVVSQQHALTSIFDTFWSEKWFHGGFLWKWFDNHSTAGGNQNKGFTVQNKTSEQIIKTTYKNY